MSSEQLFEEMVFAMMDPTPPRVVTKAEAEACMGAYVLGENDFANHRYSPPSDMFSREYDAYLAGYNDEWARQNKRTILR